MKGHIMCMTTILGTCIVAAQLTHGGISTSKAPLISSAKSYDNVSRDVSKFYTPKENRVNIGGDLYTKDTKVSLSYNNGTKTDKYKVNDSVMVQVTKHIPIKETMSINITGGYMFGGKESHTSCKDSYNREYFCGTLTSWSDFSQSDHKDQYDVSVRLSYKF